MTLRLAVALLLLLPISSSFAQSNDDLTFLHPSPAARADEPYTLGLRIAPSRGEGDAIVDWTLPVGVLQWIDPRCVDRGERTYRCTVAGIANVRASLISPTGTFFETRAIFVAPAPVTPFPKTEEVKIRAAVKTPVITMPEEESWSHGTTSVRFDFDADVPPERAELLRIGIRVPHLVRFTAPQGWVCGGGDTLLECVTPVATIHESMVVEADRGNSVDPVVSATIAWFDRHHGEDSVGAYASARAFSRTLVVTSDADNGAGSLREGMIEAAKITEYGSRVRVTFAQNVKTIRPLTPLPPLSGLDVWLDGTAGREEKVAIDASALASGPAILTAAHIVSGVRGLAVHSSPGDGIKCGTRCVIEDNYIGLDADGMTPRANWGRGIVVGDTDASIQRNVISGNYRSGIFCEASANGFATDNLIGVGADRVRPIGNGASGIFIGPQSSYQRGDGSSFTITRNVIAYHRDFGIALANPQWRVRAIDNDFIENRVSDIDVGLDGPQLPDTRITNAIYDAATDTTWIYGAIENPGWSTTIALYANGVALGSMGLNNEKTFVFRATGNHTASALTANRVIDGGFAEYPWWMSTEISEAFTSR